MGIKKNFFAPLFKELGATRRAAMLLLVMMFTTATAWAQTTITPTTPSQDADGYYLISNAAELYGFAEIVNNGNATANGKLTADIIVNENVLDANGDANTGDFVQWISIGNYDQNMTYSGTFDGQGHTVSGLYVSGSGWSVGFIGKVSGSAVVKNLGIVDSYFSSSNNFLGSIVGAVSYKSSVTLANVYSTSTVKGDNWIGGLAGGGDGSVSVVNSYFAGKTIANFQSGKYSSHHDDLVAGDFDRSTLTVCNAFVLGTSQYGTSVTAGQLSDGTVAATLHYYQDALADGSMFGISDGKTAFSGSLEGVSVTTANITLHTFDGDATAYSSKYIVGNTTPLPVNVVREGYTFLGWYDNADFEGDAVTQIPSSATGDKEYWAKFKKSHSVSFVLGGGTIQTGEIDHYIEGEVTPLPAVVLKGNASFEGWYTTEDFTGDRYYSIPSTANEDMAFYAKWGEAKTTFYLVQGGSPDPVNVLYEGENVVCLDKTTMDGYYVSGEDGYWGGFSESVNVPYTGGESTFGNGGRAFDVAQSGFYVFTLTDKGEGNWFVSVLKSMLNCDVASIPTQVYTGSAIEPAVTVTDGVNILTLGTDYEVTYRDNINAGTATVTITGKGDYLGSREVMFTITPFLADQFGAVYVYEDQNGKTALLDGTSVDPVDIDFNYNIIVNHVTSNRVFTPGKPATVMLPFHYTCDGNEGGTFYRFVGVKKEENLQWVATMQETGDDSNMKGALEANTPYLFMPAATTMTFPNINGSVRLFTRGDSGGNCETAESGSHWKFKGTYEYKEWQSGGANAEEIDRAYNFAGVATSGLEVGMFVKIASGAKIRPMCCYLLWNDMPNAANARALTRGAAVTEEELPQSITVRLVGSNGEVTGIGEIDTKTGEMTFDSEAWYTLDGVRLSGKPSKKGLYINNGKKVVIK
jgi:uncharacterized repeat protein (TIGR02543 family)